MTAEQYHGLSTPGQPGIPRIASPLGGPVDYTGGLYYFYQSINAQSRLQRLVQPPERRFERRRQRPGERRLYRLRHQWFLARQQRRLRHQQPGGLWPIYLACAAEIRYHRRPALHVRGQVRATFNQVQQGGTPLSQHSCTFPEAPSRLIRNGFSPVDPANYTVTTYNSMPAGMITFSYKPSDGYSGLRNLFAWRQIGRYQSRLPHRLGSESCRRRRRSTITSWV